MQKRKWRLLIDDAVRALELLEEERYEYEQACLDKSERWQESDAGQEAQEIIDVDIQAMIDELGDLKSKVEE